MEETLSCGSTTPQAIRVTIRKVSNGFLIETYGGLTGTKIANTLPEALELTRKEFEM